MNLWHSFKGVEKMKTILSVLINGPCLSKVPAISGLTEFAHKP